MFAIFSFFSIDLGMHFFSDFSVNSRRQGCWDYSKFLVNRDGVFTFYSEKMVTFEHTTHMYLVV